MQDLIDKLLSNPLYLAIGVILIIILFYAVIKRVVKLLIILFIALILFFVYVHYTGNSVKDKVERMIKH
jgi:cell division protein FtsW (lipid II flippase)